MNIITDAQIAFINSNPVESLEDFVAPYDFICEHQNDACEVVGKGAAMIAEMMARMSHVALCDVNDDGPCVRYCARHEDMLLFVEIDQVREDAYYVTSLFDRDEEYVLGYMGR